MAHNKHAGRQFIIPSFFIIVLALGMLLTSWKIYGKEGEDHSHASVTMLIYMNGSDLESSSGAGTKDMEEMAESGVNLNQVNVLVYAGGSTKWHNDVSDDGNVLFCLGKNGFEVIQRFEDVSMGEAETLAQFLEYGYTNYPADTYDLILWNHGNGPVMGYGIDKRHDGDSLTLPELQEALEQSPFGEKRHLGMIGFDACLMASAELACTVSDYADYLVSSQETEPNFGWNYQFLAECGEKNSEELAQSIVLDYVQYCEDFFSEKEFFRSDVTLSVFDLSCAAELEGALDDIFRKASDDVSGDYNILAAERVRCRALGRASTGSEYDLVDLGSLMGQMGESYPQEAARVQEAVERAVVFAKSNAEECCGISLFYPYFNKNYYKSSWKEEYRALGLFPSYLTYLERYDQIWLGTDFSAVYAEELKPQKGEESSTFTLQLTESQKEVYAQGTYYILRRTGEDVYCPVFISQDVTEENGLLTASFDGRILYGNDKEDESFKFIPYTRLVGKIGTQTEYVCPRMNVSRGNIVSDEFESQKCSMLLSIDEDTGEIVVKSVYLDEVNEDDTLTSGKREAVNPEEWEDFMFRDVHGRFLTRDEDGRIMPFWDWPEKGNFSLVTVSANELFFTYEPIIDDGYEYFVMFEIQDTQGNASCSELLPVTLSAAPEEKSVKKDIVWKDDSSVLLFDERGIVLTLREVKDAVSGVPYYTIVARNNNDFKITLILDDFVYNGQYSVGEELLFSLEPGSENFESLPFLGFGVSVSTLLAMEGTDSLNQLSFRLSNASQEDTERTILKNRTFSIGITKDDDQEVRVFPILDARAGRQTLYENGVIGVELLSMGRQIEDEPVSDPALPGSDLNEASLIADFLIQNRSSEFIETGIRALRINGIEYSDGGGVVKMLPPGSRFYTETSFTESDLRNLRRGDYYSGEEDKRLLRSVSKVEALLYYGDQYLWLPVTLEQEGTQGMIIPKGDLLYEDSTLSIFASGIDGTVPEESLDICLWYVNHSDRMLHCVCTMEDVNPRDYQGVTYGFDIGPGSTIVRGEPAPQDGSQAYYIHWREEGKDEYSTSGPFSY